MREAELTAATQGQLPVAGLAEVAVEKIDDERANLMPDESVLLIVEDDPHYARVLKDLGRDKGFKVLVATHGAGGDLLLATAFQEGAPADHRQKRQSDPRGKGVGW